MCRFKLRVAIYTRVIFVCRVFLRPRRARRGDDPSPYAILSDSTVPRGDAFFLPRGGVSGLHVLFRRRLVRTWVPMLSSRVFFRVVQRSYGRFRGLFSITSGLRVLVRGQCVMMFCFYCGDVQFAFSLFYQARISRHLRVMFFSGSILVTL